MGARTSHGSIIHLLPEYEERYIILHKHVFPGVLERIQKSNIRDYSIYLLDGVLFSHFEYTGKDFSGDMAAMGDEVTREWWKLTDPMQDPVAGRKEGEWWASMDTVFRLRLASRTGEEYRRAAFCSLPNPGFVSTHGEAVQKLRVDVEQIVRAHGFRALALYAWQGRFFCYCEVSERSLHSGGAQRQPRNGLASVSRLVMDAFHSLPPPGVKWALTEMREVFHTD